MSNSTTPFRLLLVSCLLAVTSSTGAQDYNTPEIPTPAISSTELRPAPEASEPGPAEIVIRVAEDLFGPLANKPFDVSQPVNRFIQGAHVVGRCRATGTTSIDVDNGRKNAAFDLTVQGQTHSRTSAYHRPAIIYNRTTTAFVAKKRIRFDGEKFVAGPTRISARTNLTREGVSSTLPGLRGAVVRSVARRRTAKLHGRSEAISSQLASQSVVAEVDSRVANELKQLNDRLATHAVVEQLLGISTSEAWSWRVSSTEKFLQLTLVMSEDAKPRHTPPLSLPMQHTIEVYVHGSVLHDNGPKIVKVWGPLAKPLGTAVHNSTAALSAALTRDDRGGLQSVGVDTRDEWVVLELGKPLAAGDDRSLPSESTEDGEESPPVDLQAIHPRPRFRR